MMMFRHSNRLPKCPCIEMPDQVTTLADSLRTYSIVQLVITGIRVNSSELCELSEITIVERCYS